MKREISVWVEWAWMKGLLSNERQSIDSSALSLALALKARAPHRFGSLLESQKALGEHIEQCLRKLSYGNHTAEKLHPKRRAYLEALPLSHE